MEAEKGTFSPYVMAGTVTAHSAPFPSCGPSDATAFFLGLLHSLSFVSSSLNFTSPPSQIFPQPFLPFSSIPLKLLPLMISSTRSVFLLLLYRLVTSYPRPHAPPGLHCLILRVSFTDLHNVLSFLSGEDTSYRPNASLRSSQAVLNEVPISSLSCFSKPLR